jgi:hypothetical protein
MTTDETQLRGLLKSAPTSLVGLMSLLIDGLGWPHYDLAIEPQDYLSRPLHSVRTFCESSVSL